MTHAAAALIISRTALGVCPPLTDARVLAVVTAILARADEDGYAPLLDVLALLAGTIPTRRAWVRRAVAAGVVAIDPRPGRQHEHMRRAWITDAGHVALARQQGRNKGAQGGE
jgi:hypothetical protein